jgi:sulfatase maturation enzyme AslB (radical SAM superfamily)
MVLQNMCVINVLVYIYMYIYFCHTHYMVPQHDDGNHWLNIPIEYEQKGSQYIIIGVKEHQRIHLYIS